MKSYPKFTSALRTRGILLIVITLAGILTVSAADKPADVPRPPTAKPAPTPPSAPPLPGLGSPAPGLDPVTGRPVSTWMDPAWPNPDRILPEVTFDALTVTDVADYLRREFKNAFDILIPNKWQNGTDAPEGLNPGQTEIRLQLRNVTASEVFNAMNLMFEAENTPCRWELRINGTRPIVILRVVPELLPPSQATPPPTPPVTRMVHFVGDLIDEKTSPTAMVDLVKMVSDIYEKAHGSAGTVIQFHKDSQLLIVTGTGEQIGFVQLTLSALREKQKYKQSPPKSKIEDTKPQ